MFEKACGLSKLHYYWGDKENLFEVVITDIHDEINCVLRDIEREGRGIPMMAIRHK